MRQRPLFLHCVNLKDSVDTRALVGLSGSFLSPFPGKPAVSRRRVFTWLFQGGYTRSKASQAVDQII